MNKNGMVLRFITAGLCTGLIVCPVLAAGIRTGAADRHDNWTALAASGPVNAREALAPENEWVKIRRGDELAPLSLVRTGRRGKATLAMDQHIFIVRSNSSVQLPDLENVDQDSQVYQDSGMVTYEVDGSAFERFEVVTPYLVAGVKGTVFSVTVTSGGATVRVEEGLVEVSSRFGDATVELFPGEEVSIDGSETDSLEIRQVDQEIRDATRRDLQAARQIVEQPVADMPLTVDQGARRETEMELGVNNAGPTDLVVNDSLGSSTGDLPINENAASTVLDRELRDERLRTIFEVERISYEEIKDLDLRKAEVVGDEQTGSSSGESSSGSNDSNN